MRLMPRTRKNRVLALVVAAALAALTALVGASQASAAPVSRPILVVVNGSSPADIGVASEVRDKCGGVLLYVSSAHTPPPVVERWVKRNHPIRVVAVGGPAVVSLELVTYLELASRMNTEPDGDGFSGQPTTSARVSGPDRYATSLAVAELNADQVCIG